MTDERCVIFDLDGVLVDSEPHWRAGFRETIDTLATGAGLEPPGIPDDELVAYEGGRVPDTLAALVRDYLPSLHPLSPALLQEATDTCVAASSARIAATPRTIAPARAPAAGKALAPPLLRLFAPAAWKYTLPSR